MTAYPPRYLAEIRILVLGYLMTYDLGSVILGAFPAGELRERFSRALAHVRLRDAPSLS